MKEIDAELLDRVSRWCAEAGRQAVPADIERALSALTWDQVLSVKALLADPPPARPLGPHALADIARGAPPDVAAEREREGRYRSEEPPGPPAAAPAPTAGAKVPGRRPRASRQSQMVIRRARDRVAAEAPPLPELPPLEDLRRPEGRAVLERLLRRHGGRRIAIARELAGGWRRRDGQIPSDADLDSLLDHHGLARAFARRERDEMLHALRAEGGVRAAAADRVGLDAAGLDAALARVGATAAAEAIREERRAELRSRATLAERARLLVGSEARLADLGLIPEFEADLRVRLPEHVRALRTAGEPLARALARSLSITSSEAAALASRLGVDLATPAGGGSRPLAPRGGVEGERRPSRPGAGASSARASGRRRPGGGTRNAPRPAGRRPARGMPDRRRGGRRPGGPRKGR